MDDRILDYASQADEVWHAGDIGDVRVTDALRLIKPLRAVHGNIDNATLRVQFPEDQRFLCEGVSVWMTHIGGYPGRYSKRVREQLALGAPRIFICGHSHILKVMSDKKYKLLHMNPGAAGTHGFHKVRTMLRFVIDDTEIQDMEVIELGKRG